MDSREFRERWSKVWKSLETLPSNERTKIFIESFGNAVEKTNKAFDEGIDRYNLRAKAGNKPGLSRAEADAVLGYMAEKLEHGEITDEEDNKLNTQLFDLIKRMGKRYSKAMSEQIDNVFNEALKKYNLESQKELAHYEKGLIVEYVLIRMQPD